MIATALHRLDDIIKRESLILLILAIIGIGGTLTPFDAIASQGFPTQAEALQSCEQSVADVLSNPGTLVLANDCALICVKQ